MNKEEDEILAGIVDAITHLQDCYGNGGAIAATNIILSSLKNFSSQTDEESTDIANISRFVSIGIRSVLLRSLSTFLSIADHSY
jgi:hypothetical protein